MGKLMGMISLSVCLALSGCFLVPESTYKSVLRDREDCQSEVKSLRAQGLARDLKEDADRAIRAEAESILKEMPLFFE